VDFRQHFDYIAYAKRRWTAVRPPSQWPRSDKSRKATANQSAEPVSSVACLSPKA